MNGPEHQLVGLLTGTVLAVVMWSANPTWTGLAWMLIVVLAALAGQILPDVLDPARLGLWWHRSIGHSWLIAMPIYFTLGGIGLIGAALTGSWPLMVLAAFGLSAFIHLVMDATTPMGLPVVVGNSLLGMALPVTVAAQVIPVVNFVALAIFVMWISKRIHALVETKGRLKATLLVAAPFLAIVSCYQVAFLLFAFQVPWWLAIIYFVIASLFGFASTVIAVAAPIVVLLASGVETTRRAAVTQAKTAGSSVRDQAQRLKARSKRTRT